MQKELKENIRIGCTILDKKGNEHIVKKITSEYLVCEEVPETEFGIFSFLGDVSDAKKISEDVVKIKYEDVSEIKEYASFYAATTKEGPIQAETKEELLKLLEGVEVSMVFKVKPMKPPKMKLQW